MKQIKTFTFAKTPLPSFQSDKEAAAYFDTHSAADIWDQLPSDQRAKLSAALQQSIQKRRETTKSPISIRLIPEQNEAAKRIAAKKSVGY